MEPIDDLPTLQKMLESLATRGLVVYLSPPGQRRGVVVTHGLYPPEEFEKVRRAFANQAAAADAAEATPARLSTARAELTAEARTPAWSAEAAALRAEIETLRNALEEIEPLRHALAEVETLKATVRGLTDELHELKSALGA
jgi:hypothetical protein